MIRTADKAADKEVEQICRVASTTSLWFSYLATELKLQQVLKVPGATRVADLENLVDLKARICESWDELVHGTSSLKQLEIHVDNEI